MGPTFEQFMLCCVFWIPWRKVLSRTGAYAGDAAVAPDPAPAVSSPAASAAAGVAPAPLNPQLD